ncbi:Protoglobin-domain-containing protein [Cokeromyces recurvatus]|uniref:Protoglobin-domain-containing protein n=1 Tax=Cokeromyces recurvatus TaxID=90255 RepID=UPI0022207856|nr:Protoglobin-domain-containing protein [Cokeromyces recurvatus]KAI7904564.1 Protoglobin-domain-containing protein [Cokeromyces recurvatus]
MQHIDEKKLYTDDKYRFEYVAAYMGFGEKDIKAIESVAERMRPLVPAIVDSVYVKQFEFDITKRYFLPKNEGFTGEVANSLDELTLDHPQIQFRKNFLGKYLLRILKGPYDDRFLKYLDWVAKIHTDTPEKKSKINVDYVHVNALMGFVESAIINGVVQLGLDREEEAVVLSAFNKLMWIQNDYYAKYYMNPYFNEAMQKKFAAEKKAQKSSTNLFSDLNIISILIGIIAGGLGVWMSCNKN